MEWLGTVWQARHVAFRLRLVRWGTSRSGKAGEVRRVSEWLGMVRQARCVKARFCLVWQVAVRYGEQIKKER